jgi:parallel beta-helix repeat protein
VGFNLDTDTVVSQNTVHRNGGVGIAVIDSSSARIVGNTISENGDGVLVLVAENSQVNLSEETEETIFDMPNSTEVNNLGFGLRCVSGGVASGLLGSLNGGTLAGSSGPESFDGTWLG